MPQEKSLHVSRELALGQMTSKKAAATVEGRVRAGMEMLIAEDRRKHGREPQDLAEAALTWWARVADYYVLWEPGDAVPAGSTGAFCEMRVMMA